MTDTPDPADAPKKKGRLGKLVLMVLGIAVLAGGGAGAGVYAARSGLVGGKSAPADNGPRLVPKSEQKAAAAKEGSGGEGAKPVTGAATPAGAGGDRYASNYYPIDKDFTANLQNSAHFIQVGIAVSTPYDDKVIEHLKTNDIAVRSAVLMALGDTTEDQVFTSQGKHALAVRLTHAINDTLKQKEGFGGVSNVYFTSFVVQ